MEGTDMQGDGDGAIVNLNPTLATTISDDDVKLVDNMDASEDGDEAEVGNGTTDDAGRKRKSPVWNEFSKITVMVKGVPVKKGECKYCKKNIAINKSGSTTQFIRHMQKCSVRLASFKKQKVLTGTDFIKVGAATNGNLGIFKFSKESVREYMAKMIIVHEYPFRMVEHEFFVLFCRMLNAQFEKISRVTIRNDCIKLHASEKNKLKIMLTSVEKISLTSDLWTSNQTIGYMCLTAHFMNSEWILQKRILNFCSLPPPHTGVSIADAIFRCLSDWGIESKVSTITLDNASSNDSAVRYLKDSFSRIGKLFFKGKIFHVRCCAHILNLMVQDGLHEIKDVIQNIRESVKYLKMSSSRLHNFAEIAKQVNISVARRLVLDVPTRWNSTYAMLESALIFRDVFPRYGDRDNNYVWLPSDLDWEKAENVCKILEVFHDASNVFSGVSYPTSNLFLPEIWKVKQILNEKSVEFDETHYLKSMVDRMKSKFEKYWGQCNLLMSIAAVLDPRFKMKLIEFSFPKIYPAQEADKNIRYVIDSLYELYAEYVASNAVSNDKDEDKAKGEASNSVSTHIKGKTKGRSEFDIWAKQMDKVEPSKSDLDVYLEEGIYLCENDEDFSALNWWKNKTLQFKLLSKMARDILSIPVSTVASKSAFSAGGRVLDQYRSSMKPETVEALICTGDWLRSEYGLANSEVGLQRDEESIQEVHLE